MLENCTWRHYVGAWAAPMRQIEIDCKTYSLEVMHILVDNFTIVDSDHYYHIIQLLFKASLSQSFFLAVLPDLCAMCPGERVRALPLQYVKISAALHLMRQAEEKMGTRFALVVRPGPCFGVQPIFV